MPEKRINKNQKRIAYRQTYLNFDGRFSFFCQQIIHSIYSLPGAMIQPELHTRSLVLHREMVVTHTDPSAEKCAYLLLLAILQLKLKSQY